MAEQTRIYDLWEIYNVVAKKKKETGTLISEGLVSIFGADRAIRELKKRCDYELQETGRPLEGCSLYVSYLYALTDLNTTYEISSDHSERSDRNERMLMVGEDQIVEVIESAWAEHKDVDKLPKGTVLDIFEEFDEIVYEKYGDVKPRTILSEKECELSRTLAHEHGKRKTRRKPTAKPAREETPEEPEPDIEFKEQDIVQVHDSMFDQPAEFIVKTAKEMRDEVRSKLKRA